MKKLFLVLMAVGMTNSFAQRQQHILSQEIVQIEKNSLEVSCYDYVIKDPCRGGECAPRGDERRERVQIHYSSQLHGLKRQVFQHRPTIDRRYKGKLCKTIKKALKKNKLEELDFHFERLFSQRENSNGGCDIRFYKENLIVEIAGHILESKFDQSRRRKKSYKMSDDENCTIPRNTEKGFDQNFSLNLETVQDKLPLYKESHSEKSLYLGGDIKLLNNNIDARFMLTTLILQWKFYKENYAPRTSFMFIYGEDNLEVNTMGSTDIDLYFTGIGIEDGYNLKESYLIAEGFFVDEYEIPFTREIRSQFSIETTKGTVK